MFFNVNDWNVRTGPTRLKCDGYDVNDKKIDQVKWFRQVVGNKPGYTQKYYDAKVSSIQCKWNI